MINLSVLKRFTHNRNIIANRCLGSSSYCRMSIDSKLSRRPNIAKRSASSQQVTPSLLIAPSPFCLDLAGTIIPFSVEFNSCSTSSAFLRSPLAYGSFNMRANAWSVISVGRSTPARRSDNALPYTSILALNIANIWTSVSALIDSHRVNYIAIALTWFCLPWTTAWFWTEM